MALSEDKTQQFNEMINSDLFSNDERQEMILMLMEFNKLNEIKNINPFGSAAKRSYESKVKFFQNFQDRYDGFENLYSIIGHTFDAKKFIVKKEVEIMGSDNIVDFFITVKSKATIDNIRELEGQKEFKKVEMFFSNISDLKKMKEKTFSADFKKIGFLLQQISEPVIIYMVSNKTIIHYGQDDVNLQVFTPEELESYAENILIKKAFNGSRKNSLKIL